MSELRRIVRVNRLLAEVGHADVIDALEELKRLRAAAQPVAVFDGYLDGGAAVIQWRGKALPAGTLLYAARGEAK